MADAAAEVARRNGDRPIHELPAEEVERVYSALHHSHVPQLVEQGAVAFDRERNVVTLTDRGQRLARLREQVTGQRRDAVVSYRL
jgi:tRNA threonylcarbamoyladenosine modification (KEOPS) complex  Pcc1 subunit